MRKQFREDVQKRKRYKVNKMVTWADLASDGNRTKWEGVERIPIESVLGKNFLVLDYELFDTGVSDQGIRILLGAEDGAKRYIITYGQIIVEAFKKHPEKVKELIDKKIPMCIIERSSSGGFKYYAFQ